MDEKITSEAKKDIAAEVHPLLLLRELLRKFWVVVLAAIIVGSFTYIGASYMYTPKYQTVTTFVVSVRNGDSSVYSNLNAAKSMANAFSEVLNSDVMRKRISTELGTAINGTITANVIEETNLLEMRVTSSSPRQTYLITKATLNNYSELAETVLNNITLDVLQQPVIPTAPTNPNRAGHTAKIGALLAAAAAAALICVKAYLRDTVKSISEVESKLDTKLLAAVYHERKYKTLREALNKKKKSIVIINPTTGFSFVETYKKLRTRIEYLMRKNKCKVLMVTSVAENEGKSTAAVNIALAMNRKRKSVLLVDADMKKPSLHKILEYQDAEYASITDYLAGKATLGQTLMTDKKRQLGLLLGKNGTDNSTELIKSDNMAELIDQAKRNVDMVIIDTPPMAVSPDAECIAELADAAILVVRQDWTPTRIINDAIDAINSTNTVLLGCLFNNVYLADINEHYNYGGSGKYGYVKNGYGKKGYGKYGYGKYGYGKYGYDRRKRSTEEERLQLEDEQQGKGFLEDANESEY